MTQIIPDIISQKNVTAATPSNMNQRAPNHTPNFFEQKTRRGVENLTQKNPDSQSSETTTRI